MIAPAARGIALAALLTTSVAGAEPPPAAPAAPVGPVAAENTPNPLPYGNGTVVTVVTTRAAQIFVAPVGPRGAPPSDYDFKRVGVAPASFQLPPGRYVIEVEDEGVTSQELDLVVGTDPVHLQIRTGSSDMATVGSLTLGIGILCVLSGAVLLISGSKAPSSLDKSKIVIPLFAAGGALVGGGIGLYFASRTSIERNPAPVAPPAPRAYVAGVRVAF